MSAGKGHKKRIANGPMSFGIGRKIYIHYKASEEKGGELMYQTNREDGPDILIYGSDANESQLELLLMDKCEGSHVSGWVKHDAADPDGDWSVPRGQLPKNGDPSAPMQGSTLVMLDEEDIPITPRILYVDDLEVRLSLNSPWAGKTLWMELIVVRVLPCTSEELSSGVPDDYKNAIAELVGQS